MNFGDTVNGLFEAFGALFTWRNALQLHRDKEIKGVYWPITAFFACWGLWNLWYYPSLGQWLSFWAGCLLVLGNICWVAQAVGLWLRKRRDDRVLRCECGDVNLQGDQRRFLDEERSAVHIAPPGRCYKSSLAKYEWGEDS